MKLLLADDHSLFREALVQYIERADPDAEVLLAGNVAEALEIMEGGIDDIDIVLLDFRMPGMNGLKGFEKVRKAFPDIPVVILSGMAEQEDVKKAMKGGAAGYLPKTLSGKELLKGIRKVLDGERYVAMDYDTTEIMPSYYGEAIKTRPKTIGLSDIGQPGAKKGVSLTPREKEVLGYLLKGSPNKEIARDLGLQIVTVKLHVRGVCRKLGAKNRTQAALIARDMGWH